MLMGLVQCVLMVAAVGPVLDAPVPKAPLTPVIDLVRAGWTGGMGAGETLQALATAAAWTALAGWTVRRRFPWEPRR
ncbi:hypothetical protein [Streptomyces milbemycinicus]|uniref:Uncharacterized protein n=1 Tax=Streptomyces milbemycinicus TaxID=476552 RepID=A0ABW8LWS5_9ACTN